MISVLTCLSVSTVILCPIPVPVLIPVTFPDFGYLTFQTLMLSNVTSKNC